MSLKKSIIEKIGINENLLLVKQEITENQYLLVKNNKRILEMVTNVLNAAEVAANIAIDVLKMESEGIKVVKDALIAEKEATRRSSSISQQSNQRQTT